MSTLIYIVRHGESEGNRADLFLGHTDLPLTEKGRVQAALAGGYAKEKRLSFDKVYASPLCRAYETAEIIGRAAGYTAPPVPLPGMREIDAGLWENRFFDDLIRDFPHSYGEVWRHHIGLATADGGESVRALSDRVCETLFAVAAENEGKVLLIGTHATPLRAIQTYAEGLAAEEMEKVKWPSNASLSVYRVEAAEKRVECLCYSFSDYLGQAATYLPPTV